LLTLALYRWDAWTPAGKWLCKEPWTPSRKRI
jgi:hypothetical protein